MARTFLRMTDREWRQVLPFLNRLTSDRREAAYRHLVKGLSLAIAGEPYNLRRQSVHDVVQRVLEKWSRLTESDSAKGEGVKKGWVRLTLDVPAANARNVQRFAAAVAMGVTQAEATAAHTPKSVAAKRTAAAR